MMNPTSLGDDRQVDDGAATGSNGQAAGEPGRLLSYALAVAIFGHEFVEILLASAKHHGDGAGITWTPAGLEEAVDLAQWDFRHHYFHTEEVAP
jgi:hypothetical protein